MSHGKIDYADIRVLEWPDTYCPNCKKCFSVCYAEILEGLDESGNELSGEAFHCTQCDSTWLIDDYVELVRDRI